MTHGGAAAEDAALAYLAARGCVLRERNYRCRFGEIDLIVDHRGTLVFAEVRKRSNPRFGGAAASITSAKQQRVIAAARHYLARAGTDLPCRFDAVLVDGAGQIEWLQDAFAE